MGQGETHHAKGQEIMARRRCAAACARVPTAAMPVFAQAAATVIKLPNMAP